jgi:hypothetical protein
MFVGATTQAQSEGVGEKATPPRSQAVMYSRGVEFQRTYKVMG